jgi:hypothetical protein
MSLTLQQFVSMANVPYSNLAALGPIQEIQPKGGCRLYQGYVSLTPNDNLSGSLRNVHQHHPLGQTTQMVAFIQDYHLFILENHRNRSIQEGRFSVKQKKIHESITPYSLPMGRDTEKSALDRRYMKPRYMSTGHRIASCEIYACQDHTLSRLPCSCVHQTR